MVPGLTSTAQSGYIKHVVERAAARGYEVVVINYRGLAGMELKTPKLYNSYAYQDVLEPMTHVYNKHCRGKERQAFAVGCSMGANILANLMGHEGDGCCLDAACILAAPMKKWECQEGLRTGLYGAYNYFLGGNLNRVLLRHEPVLRDHFKERLGMDIIDFVNGPSRPSILDFDNLITAPYFGYADREDYYRKAACYHRIPHIRKPVFFMNALDDPIVGEKAIEYDLIMANPHTVLGTSRHGGHLGYHTRTFSMEQWFMTPVLDFLDTFRK